MVGKVTELIPQGRQVCDFSLDGFELLSRQCIDIGA